MRVVLALAFTFDWVIKKIDVNTTFLKGEMEDKVYMDQPQGFVDLYVPNRNANCIKLFMV